MNLSDTNVVKWLILFRDKIDIYYKSNNDNFYINAGNVKEVNQELLNTYIYLDQLIIVSDLTEKQKALIELFYEGFTYRDIAYYTKTTAQRIERRLKSICTKICKTNKKRWIIWTHENYLNSEFKRCRSCHKNLPKTKSIYRVRSDFKGDGFYGECKECEKNKRK
ncbi:hypothetical protein ERL59_06565 [Chengkuizengella sp. YPA3-1-1]|uniref:Uncharacterized protein n=1 Tax=Chengkuizengella marina TaxID=2507566 RepID=A0A6N9Q292_9BACL|nr:hypothetical protein [Chengkuizengella marina]